MKMAEYGLPLHVQTSDNAYVMDDHYHDNGVTSPHDLGPWIEDSDGGGKFRLKRRRRCGQCGPCQVKENCGKCQYCVRKDVLKQACIYRKCIYLRKPVPRFRSDAPGTSGSVVGGTGSSSSSAVSINGGSAGSASASLSKTSPQKASSTPSTLTNHGMHPTPSPFNPAMAAAAAAVQSAELSSCQLTQTPFGLPMNNGVIDPLRTSALDQHRSALFDATGMLDPARTAYLSSARGLDPGRSPALDLGRNTGTADSGLGTSGSSLPTSPASQTKDRPAPREQFRSPMEQWGVNLPYAFPRNPWAHPVLQPNHAAYGFQSTATHFPSPFGSSCRLGMPDPTVHLTGPPQPTFPHNMPFPRPDFTTPNYRGSGPPMQATMTPPFYPPPPHIPSSLPNFPSFNQLPSSAGPHGAYPIPHPPMYPGNFYSSFRPHNEPQIYHALLPPPELPFLGPGGLGSRLQSLWGKQHKFSKDTYDDDWESDKGENGKGGKDKDSEDDEDDLKKKFSIFRIPHKKHISVSTLDRLGETLDLTKFGLQDQETLRMHRHSFGASLGKDKECVNSNSDLRPCPTKELHVDEDLQEQMKRISGRGECDVISIDDFKMQAFIRSEGFNNLEIEIDDTLSPTNVALNSPCHHHHSPYHNSGLSKHHHHKTQQGTDSQKICTCPRTGEDADSFTVTEGRQCSVHNDKHFQTKNYQCLLLHYSSDFSSHPKDLQAKHVCCEVPENCSDQYDNMDEISAVKDSSKSRRYGSGHHNSPSYCDFPDQRRDDSDSDRGLVPLTSDGVTQTLLQDIDACVVQEMEDREGGMVPVTSNAMVTQTLLQDVDVCVVQEVGEEVVRMEVSGSKARVENVVVDEDLLRMSLDPHSLLRFLSHHASRPMSISFQSDSDQMLVPPS